jgi:hypothetical protein
MFWRFRDFAFLWRYFLGEITEVSGVMSEKIFALKGSEDNAMAIFRSLEHAS